MVLTFKKDWSPDLSYSSLAQDQKVREIVTSLHSLRVRLAAWQRPHLENALLDARAVHAAHMCCHLVFSGFFRPSHSTSSSQSSTQSGAPVFRFLLRWTFLSRVRCPLAVRSYPWTDTPPNLPVFPPAHRATDQRNSPGTPRAFTCPTLRVPTSVSRASRATRVSG